MPRKAECSDSSPMVVEYDDFRTGLRFKDVRDMLWSGSSDPKDWKYKRRHTVLGLWRSLKLGMYDQYLGQNDVPSTKTPF